LGTETVGAVNPLSLFSGVELPCVVVINRDSNPTVARPNKRQSCDHCPRPLKKSKQECAAPFLDSRRRQAEATDREFICRTERRFFAYSFLRTLAVFDEGKATDATEP
jgi:hypothetical protein